VPGGQFKWGACLQKSNGGVYQGWLGPDGNRPGRVKAYASFTARLTGRAVAKAELSEPTAMFFAPLFCSELSLRNYENHTKIRKNFNFVLS